MSTVQKREALESSKLPFFHPEPIEYDWGQEIKDIKLRYKLAYPLGWLLMHGQFGKIRAYGQENIPLEGGFLLAANHQSNFDPISIYFCMKGKRCMYFMAKEEFFHTFYTRAVFNFFHAFPVQRSTADKDSIDFAERVIKTGHVLTVFPQGTRDLTHGKPKNFMPGTAMIAREAKADVLPVSIHYEQGKKFRPDLVVRYGQMIPYEELGFTEGSRKSRELRKASQLIEDRVAELWEMDEK